MAKSPFTGKWFGVGCVNSAAHMKAIKCGDEFIKKMVDLIPKLGREPFKVEVDMKVDPAAETFQFTVDYKDIHTYSTPVLQFGQPVKQHTFIHGGTPVEMVVFKKSDKELLMYRKSDDYWLDMTFRVDEDILVLVMTGNGVTATEYYKRLA